MPKRIANKRKPNKAKKGENSLALLLGLFFVICLLLFILLALTINIVQPSGLTGYVSFEGTGESSSRSLPATYTPGSAINVSIDIVPSGGTTVWGGEEDYPSGWAISGITCTVVSTSNPCAASEAVDSGGRIVLGAFFDNLERVLTYNATPPALETGTKTFSGKIGYYEGNAYAEAAIDGTSTISKASVPGVYSLTLSKSGAGTVTSADGNINCGSTCSADYSSNSNVTLTAVPDVGYFVTWTGCNGSGNTCTLTMDSDKTVTATFALASEYILAVTTSGSGSVTSADGNINCGSSCISSYMSGSAVSLTATPAADYSVSWAGCSASGNTCALIMDSNKAVSATFTYNNPGNTGGPGGSGNPGNPGGPIVIPVPADRSAPSIVWLDNNNLFFGLRPVGAKATDNNAVLKVEFYLGTVLRQVSRKDGNNYWLDLNTLDLNNGAFMLKAVAYDFAGNKSEISRTVIVNNPAIKKQVDTNLGIPAAANLDTNNAIANVIKNYLDSPDSPYVIGGIVVIVIIILSAFYLFAIKKGPGGPAVPVA